MDSFLAPVEGVLSDRSRGMGRGSLRRRLVGACASALLLVAALPGSECVAQEAPGVEGGARVRIVASDLYPEPVVGTVMGLDDETIVLQLKDQDEPAIVHREAITRLEVSQGRGNRGRATAIGAVAGALVGLLAVELTPEGSCGSSNPWSCVGVVSKDEVAPAVAGLGAGLGALLGLAIGHGERWTVVPIVRVNRSPGERRHVRVSLSGAF